MMIEGIGLAILTFIILMTAAITIFLLWYKEKKEELVVEAMMMAEDITAVFISLLDKGQYVDGRREMNGALLLNTREEMLKRSGLNGYCNLYSELGPRLAAILTRIRLDKEPKRNLNLNTYNKDGQNDY